MNITRWLDRDVRRFGSYEALVVEDRSWTNLELFDYACRFAGALQTTGFAPGTAIAINLPPGIDYLVAFEGILRSGCVAVPLSPASPPGLVDRILEHSGAAAVIQGRPAVRAGALPSGWGPRVLPVGQGARSRAAALEFWQLIATHDPLSRPVSRKDDDPAVLRYSSGTTGSPRGVIETHGALADVSRPTKTNVPVAADEPEDRTILATLPPWHAYGGAQLIRRMFRPTRIVMLRRFDPERVLDAIARYRVRHFALVPTFAEALLSLGSTIGRYDLSSLRFVVVGGATAPTALIERLEAALGVPVRNVYGMTEGGGTSTGDSPVRKSGSVGRPFASGEMRIVGPDGKELPHGNVGEVEVRTRAGFAGYFRDPEATAAAMHDGWRRTGDLGYLDADGDLFLTGRKDDLIIQGGTNIAPEEVEQVLRSVAGVEDAAVVGVKSAFLGEQMVACVVRHRGALVSTDAIMAACRSGLDENKVPAAVRFVDALPKTELGKIRRFALRRTIEEEQNTERQTAFVSRVQPLTPRQKRDAICDAIAALAEGVAGGADRPGTVTLDHTVGLSTQGLTSLRLVQLTNGLSDLIGRPIEATVVFNHPTIDALTEFVLQALNPGTGRHLEKPAGAVYAADAIAIIGIGCRFPGGADSPDQYWQMLCRGIDATRDLPPDRFPADADGVHTWGAGNYRRRGAVLEALDRFDAEFFHLSAREASRLGPARRLLLEVAWNALEDAGQEPDDLAEMSTGVYVGAMGQGSQLAGVVSYFLNLRGPSVVVDTACSASLVAVHAAVEALRLGECRAALAGGVHVIESSQAFAGASQLQLLAPDGRCRAFDAAADGTVLGEGCGVVVLKRLQDALDARDRIIAVIRGSAVNHNGRSSSPMAPNGAAQSELIHAALRKAGVAPADVQFVEAHGTGTRLGDPIEVEAVVEALAPAGTRPIVIGAVKTNIGHTQAAAGVAGLIKAALCVERGLIPPNLHFQALNPLLDSWRAAIAIPTALQKWPDTTGRPRTAGVTSMGLYGTNAHVVITEPPRLGRDAEPTLSLPGVLCVSGRSEETLRESARGLEGYLAGADDDDLGDVCYTAAVGRRHFPYRLAIVARTRDSARARLADYASKGTAEGVVAGVVAGVAAGRPRVAFLFTGQGSQYADMGRELWETEPAFREAFLRCDAVLRPLLSQSIAEILYPPGRSGDEALLDQPDLAEPALFALEWSLSELWRSWGVVPDVVLGHDLGEYVAVCVAGMLDVEAVLPWVADRGRLRNALPSFSEPRIAVVSSVDACVAEGCRIFVEIGPERSSREQISETLAELHVLGATPDWKAFYRNSRVKRVAIPTYPFQRALINEGLNQGLNQGTRQPVTVEPAVPNRSKGVSLERLRGETTQSAAPIIRDWLRQVLGEVLDMASESVGANQNLFELGFDSVRVMDLMTVVGEHLQLRCAPAEFISRPTLADFSDYLAERIAGVSFGAQRSPIVAINGIGGNGSRAPLFCVHPAGGEITCYLRLRELLGPGQPLYGIRSRGLDAPRREHASLESMAIDYATLIQTQHERGPYLLFGWSMGALACHAVAGELERRGARVSLVTMVDPPGPGSTEERDSLADVLLAVRGICHELQLPQWTRPGDPPKSLSQAGPAAVYEWCMRERLIPENAIAPDAFERSLDLRLRQHRLVRQYQPHRIDAPVQIWWAGAISRGAHAFDGYSAVQPRHERVEADHFTIMQRPALDRILRSLWLGPSDPAATINGE